MLKSNLAQAVDANRDWLSSLKLIDALERWLALIAIIFTVPMFISLAPLLHLADALVLPLTHIAALLMIFVAASRPWGWRLAGLLLLSEIHLLGYVLLGGTMLSLISNIYLVIAILVLFAGFVCIARTDGKWSQLNAQSTRDDFQWLVTQGPLRLRWYVSFLLRK